MTSENAYGRSEAADAMDKQEEDERTRSIGTSGVARTRIGLFAWRKEIAASTLTSTQRLVCHTLALHMDTEGGSCFPATPTIASEAGCKKRAVELALAAIEAAGFVNRRRGGASGRGDKSTYEATVPTGNRAHQERPSLSGKGVSSAPIDRNKGVSETPKGRSSRNERAHHERPRKSGARPEVLREAVDDEIEWLAIGGDGREIVARFEAEAEARAFADATPAVTIERAIKREPL
jgi:hypothetical protein